MIGIHKDFTLKIEYVTIVNDTGVLVLKIDLS